MNLEYVVVRDDDSGERAKCWLLCRSERRNMKVPVYMFRGLEERRGEERRGEELLYQG
jgi:hypothetical protein